MFLVPSVGKESIWTWDLEQFLDYQSAIRRLGSLSRLVFHPMDTDRSTASGVSYHLSIPLAVAALARDFDRFHFRLARCFLELSRPHHHLPHRRRHRSNVLGFQTDVLDPDWWYTVCWFGMKSFRPSWFFQNQEPWRVCFDPIPCTFLQYWSAASMWRRWSFHHQKLEAIHRLRSKRVSIVAEHVTGTDAFLEHTTVIFCSSLVSSVIRVIWRIGWNVGSEGLVFIIFIMAPWVRSLEQKMRHSTVELSLLTETDNV